MEIFTSSHAIIKALKGPDDPPNDGGPLKIDIARKAWESANVHFPNKDEVLTEWILSSFIKFNKDAWGPSAKGLVLSAPYWKLVSDILNAPSEHARQNRVWLKTLLSRVSILNIVTIFFKCATYMELGRKEGLVDSFIRCMHVLWPLAAARMHLDTLTDCLGSILKYLAYDSTQLNSVAPLCLLATRSFKQAVGNTTGKKKAFSWFIDQSFLHWVHLECLESSVSISLNREAKLFASEVYQAGIDVIFCLDSLKGSTDPLEAILSDSKYSLSSLQSSQYQIVPMLYRSYMQEMRKHRYAVFGSGSSQVQDQTVQNKLRDAGVKAFRLCYRALREWGDVLEVWKSVLALVEALEEENLVGFGLEEGMDVLTEIARSAVVVLTKSEDNRVEISEAALQILCALSHIDFDLLNPLLTEMFSGLLMMNPSMYPSTHTLLHAVLDFHSKTRTMPAYLMILLKALSDGSIAARHSDVSVIHQSCMSGVLLSIVHLKELSRCIKSFLTPSQTPEVADSSFATFQTIWIDYSENISAGENATDTNGITNGPVQEHRKSDSHCALTIEQSALLYSLVSRVVAVILPSLPFSSISEPVHASIHRNISNCWIETLARAAQAAFTASDAPDERWAAQCISSATLRIRHALLTCLALQSLDVSNPSIATVKDTTALIHSSSTIPELVIELLRAFFDSDFRSAGPRERDTIIDAMIAYLKTNLRVGESEERTEEIWNGSTSSLNPLEPEGHERGALTIWHLLLDRWLSVLDDIASQEHLESVSGIILLDVHHLIGNYLNPNKLSSAWVLDRALHSAAFWELPNIRDAMVSQMDSSTRHADWEDFAQLLDQVENYMARTSSKSSACTWTADEIQTVLATFSLLLRAPLEYLARNSRLSFVRRAIVADLVLSLFEHQVEEQPAVLARETRSVVRTWLISLSGVFDIVEVVSDKLQQYTRYLMHSTGQMDGNGNAFDVVTLKLLSCVFRHTIHSAVHNKEDWLEALCALLQESSSCLAEQCRLRFIEILTAECPSADKLSPPHVEAIRKLCFDMQAQYSDALSRMLASMQKVGNEHPLIVRSWRTCLTLRKWLNISGNPSSFGIQLIRKMMGTELVLTSIDEGTREYSTEIFILLLEELNNVSPEERKKHLEITVSAYILLSGRLMLIDQATCDMALGRAVRWISINEFAYILNLLREALDKGLASSSETRTALHLSKILLEDTPEGAMKVIQEHFEECLHIFCDEPKFVTGDPELSLEMLTFIGKACSEKPAYLRHLAFGPIWLLSAKLLTGSTTHTQESHVDVLHSITAIAGSLMRLRRDLVTSTLPHLGMVLSSLLRSLRAPRAQLGARQRAQVSDTLPWWVSPTAPLGVPEARAVARLLTTLQAKTIPRIFTSRSKEKDKEKTSESLLGAFSKHAGPVLGAYIAALVDPLVVIDTSMREALAPGLYALCEAMGEHGRDALMASGCDAAGRMVFKALWKEYDKQRYVGRG